MFVVNKWRCIICANMFASTCLYILKKIRTHTYSFDIEKALAMQRPPKEVHITCCSICSIHLWFHTCCLQCSTSWKQMSNARKMHRIKRCKSMSVLQQFLLCIDEKTTSPFSSLYLQHWLSKSYKEFASRKFRLWQWCAKVETHQWIVFFLCVIVLLLGLAVMETTSCPFPAKVKANSKSPGTPTYIRNIYIYAYIHQTHCNIIHPFHISHYILIYPIMSLPSALTGGGSVFTGSIFTAWAFEDLRVPKIWIFNGGFLTQKWSCQGLHPSCLLHEGLCKLVLWFGCWAALMDNFFVYAIATQ